MEGASVAMYLRYLFTCRERGRAAQLLRKHALQGEIECAADGSLHTALCHVSEKGCELSRACEAFLPRAEGMLDTLNALCGEDGGTFILEIVPQVPAHQAPALALERRLLAFALALKGLDCIDIDQYFL